MKRNIIILLFFSVGALSFAQTSSENATTTVVASDEERISLQDEILARIKQSAVVKTLTLKGGVKYEGEVKGKKPNGCGKAVYPNGDTYIGEFSRGVRQGKGVYIYKDGECYEGAFVNDRQHGKGVYGFNEGRL